MHPSRFAVAFLLVLAAASSVLAQDPVRFACSEAKKFGPTASTREKLGACHKSEEYGEGKKDVKCRAFCNTEAIRALKDGLPNKAAFEQIIDSEFPEADRKTSKELLNFCFEKHGEIDLKDEKCINIAAFSACATSLVTKVSCP